MIDENPLAARGLALAVVLLTALAALLIPLAPARAAATPTCQHITGPFHTRGNVVTGAGRARYVPYGINVVGLAHPLTVAQRTERPLLTGTVSSDEQIMQAAATFWCANTVRDQIEQDYLVNADGTINKTFLAAIESEVSYARGLGLVVVLNCQTQLTKAHAREFMPTRLTYAFWDSLAYHYRGDPGVVFDLLNEPTFIQWSQWRNGGTSNGVRFYGMQQLADRIRGHDGARNLLWVEGPHTGGSLQYAWQHRLSGVYPLEYVEHRPAGPHTAARWRTLFGYLATSHLAPVVEGEWADYARTNAPWTCWDDAPQAVPAFLRYLGNHAIGAVVTKMTPGQLIESASLTDPTRIKANWACRDGLNEGAGNQIRNWFSRHN